MSKLEFLEISEDLMSYYRTLSDVNYFLTSDTEVEKQNLQAVSHVISKLIYGFIRINGKAFREMNREQYETEFHLFYDDFLSIIQNSGENNVEFDHFTSLVDELMGIAIKRQDTLGKIKNADTAVLTDNNKLIADEIYHEVEVDPVLDAIEDNVVSSSIINLSDVDGLVEAEVVEVNGHEKRTVAVPSIIEEVQEAFADDKIEEVQTVVAGGIVDEVKTVVVEGIVEDVKTVDVASIVKDIKTEDVESIVKDVDTAVIVRNVEEVTPAVAEVSESKPEVVKGEIEAEKELGGKAGDDLENVKDRFVDVGIYKKSEVNNNDLNHYESDDNYRFRPRRRKNR